MNKKIMLICIAVCLAAVGLWFLSSEIAQAANPHSVPYLADKPLSVVGTPPTPTLRLVTPGGDALPSPLGYSIHISETAFPLRVSNPLASELEINARLLAFRSSSGELVPATLSLSPTSQIAAGTGAAEFTLSIEEGWLPAGKYSGTLGLSAEGTETPDLEFILLVSPWTAALEWVDEETLVYVADMGNSTATVQFVVRNGDAENIQAELTTLKAQGGATPTVPFVAANLITPTIVSEPKNAVSELTLDFFNAQKLPPGTYEGVLRLSASNAADITMPFTLIIPDPAPASLWPAELVWAQEDFVFVANAEGQVVIRFAVRYTDTENVEAEIVTLAARGSTSTPLRTDFITSSPINGKEGELNTFEFTFGAVDKLPVPGIYDGKLRLSAQNARPIETQFTLVVPDHPRGSYHLEYAEVGQTPVTATLPPEKSLQFTGVRQLPGLTPYASQFWGALLFSLGLAALVGYPAWVLFEHKLPKQRGTINLFTGWLVLGTALVFAIAMAVMPALKLQTVNVEERNLLIWEKEMRGPVRNVTVQAGEVSNELGETGNIRVTQSEHPPSTTVEISTIKAGNVQPIEVSDSDIPRPSTYVGGI